MTKTEHYDLPQWEPTDRVLREDFNAAMRSIESAIPRIAFGTYVGTGTYKTSYTELNVGFAPKFIFILNGTGSRYIHALAGVTRVNIASSTNIAYFCTLEWTSTGLQWRNTTAQMQATS